MKFSKVSLLAAASTVLAAPAAVTVTEHVHQQHTAIVQGLVVVESGSTFTSWTTMLDESVSASTSTDAASTSVAAVSTTSSAAQTTSSSLEVVQDYDVASSDVSYSQSGSAQSTSTASAASQSVAATFATTSSAEATTTLSPSTTSAATTTSPSTSAVASTSASSTSSSASASSSSSDFASAILAEHNTKRALHEDTSDLTWSDTLATYAQDYADNYDCSGNLVHSGGQYGENLALGYSNTGAVDAWYSEISSYDFSNPGYSSSTGHFTQVVWKSSTELGCGIKSCDNEWGNYIICSYNPAGNVIGEFDSNVMALK